MSAASGSTTTYTSVPVCLGNGGFDDGLVPGEQLAEGPLARRGDLRCGEHQLARAAEQLREVSGLTPEEAAERVRVRHWGPRTLDLDIMLFGNEVINTPRLTVPHYDMQNRGFMLWPLFEIAPELCFPDGLALRDVLANLGAEKPGSW